MNKLRRLNKVLDEVESTACQIMESTFSIMNELKKDDNDILYEFLTNNPHLKSDVDQARFYLREASFTLLGDAREVIDQIDKFTTHLLIGDESLDSHHESYPFLYQVWRGDMYDVDGLDGLKGLLKELKEQMTKCNVDYLIQHANPQPVPSTE